MNPFDLTGRVAVVTGANTGLGQGIALALAAAGADIAAVGRTPAEDTAAQVRALGRRAELINADLSTIEPVGRVVSETLERLGGLDILVNNAGIIRRADARSGQVGRNGNEPSSSGNDISLGLRHGRPTDTDDIGTCLRKPNGDGPADAGIGAGDDRRAAGKIEADHRSSSIGTLSMSVKLMLSPAMAQMKA